MKHLKNSVLENPDNMPMGADKKMRGIIEDYAHKNVVKSPANLSSLSRIATERSKEWKSGRKLTISFMGGNKAVKDRIIRHAKRWMEYAKIEFIFLTGTKKGDVRISFDANDGSWSYIGTDLLAQPVDEATMNFGWLTPTTNDEEYSRVVLHEFGHTLGCIHEHERPDNGIPWDLPKVYAYYAQTDGWSKEEVDQQVLKKYDKDLIRASKIDKFSIMMYPVPNELTIGDYEVGWNTDLTKSDKSFIKKLYH
jgi:hypothetical protein